MKITIEMPAIDSCGATGCAFNLSQKCHARAITIGDGVHPACDTYVAIGSHQADPALPAGVGACKVEVCRHNRELACVAPSIVVAPHAKHADCVTFDSR